MKRKSRLREFIRPRGRLQKALRVGGLALLVMPEPVTTPIGITLLGISLAVPPERHRRLIHGCGGGASVRRGSLSGFTARYP